MIHGLLVSAGNQDTEKQRRWQRWEWIRFPFTFRAFLPARTFVLQVQKVETNTQNSNADRAIRLGRPRRPAPASCARVAMSKR